MIDVTKVSDKIPKELIKERRFWHSHGSHILNVVNLQPAVWNSFVPLTHRNLICFTMGVEGHEGFASSGGIPICGGCRHPRSWFSHFCVSCGDFFIRDFYSPKFCDLYPVCWDCLPELPWASCPDHGSKNTRFLKVVPPVGLNPHKFTKEEIDDVFGPGFFD